MKLWLDTIDFQAVKHAQDLGILAGVTTNPAILGAANEDVEGILDRLLDIQSGQLAVQVCADDLAGQLKQARRIARKSPRIVIKIPAIGDGFQAMATLEKEGVATLATAIFETRQVVMAGMVGARYAAPYVNRIEQSTGNAFAMLEQAQHILDSAGYPTAILGAAIKSVDQFIGCARLGIAAITLPTEVYRRLFASSTDIDGSLAQFDAAWAGNPLATSSHLFDV
ncbi:hypothetical protein CXB49_22675 [Chromobacterium sp. ATCC 53434]|uniref:transaldolase family protein n=1 Tax=Chromobacterium sp. (strain ATCC 53434 / SC 14030) TaxID=2059672 RepID=UPI000C77053C|nr:transaldolase family protein [Chromobacterium sp. ATCC 53434]AUH53380.1 hypothetical protein CXB49_22675 [Chromobacterium sp. ATCC 53434]